MVSEEITVVLGVRRLRTRHELALRHAVVLLLHGVRGAWGLTHAG